jgi:SAM-dependent methyltransferase
MTVQVCGQCGFVDMPDNTHDYTKATSTNHLGGGAARLGTEEIPGREFGMAQLGVDVLGRSGLSVLIYGVGRSMDNHHIGGLPDVARVAIGDIMKIRDDGEFVDLGRPATEQFDLVVASEVVEHFEDPKAEFSKLFGFVRPDGMLICSTNIYDGGDLSRQGYIFRRGHVSYYSPEALHTIAAAHGQLVDFRVPLAAAEPGLRKRYVIFARDRQIMAAVRNYFGRHSFAPSERPHGRRPARRQPARGGTVQATRSRAAARRLVRRVLRRVSSGRG